MPLVRVHEASDGKLFKNYEDYVIHEEGIKFDAFWADKFSGVFEGNANLEYAVKQFIKANQAEIVKLIEVSTVKRKGGKKQ
ncbi:hypothetical protein WKH82_17985 [Acinetobacter baumannii]|nr:hypothetical protein [Acinetobacter baumannii]